jgi:hypothetical protein
MKKSNFVVNEVDIADPRKNYQLIPDLKQGFKQARRSNQMMLAMEYLEKILDILDDHLDAPHEQAKVVADKPVSNASAKKANVANTQENES